MALTPMAVYFQEVKPGDVRKAHAESNVDPEKGGGARDLRVPKDDASVLFDMFTDSSEEEGVYVAKILWDRPDGGEGGTTVELWRPTEARPNEWRIARIHQIEPWGVDAEELEQIEQDGDKLVYLLTQDLQGRVWAEAVSLEQLVERYPEHEAYIRRRVQETPGNQSVRGALRLSSPNSSQIDEDLARRSDEEVDEAETVVDYEERFDQGDYSVPDTFSRQRVRIGQSQFRRRVLENFGGACCVCGADEQALLDAAHIESWNDTPAKRLDPRNGLCFCALHHRAYDRGILTIENGTVLVDERLLSTENQFLQDALVRFHEEPISEARQWPVDT